MKITDEGLSTGAAGNPTMPSWMKDYIQTAQSYTARKKAALAAATPNWMQPYLPTQPVQAAPSPRTREGRMGGTTPSYQGTAPMYGPGQSPGKDAREERTGRGGQVARGGEVPAWMHNLYETMKASGGFTGTGGGYIPNYVPASVEQAGTRTPEQKALASLMERTGGVPVGPGSSWINKLAQAVPWGGTLSNLETPEWMHNLGEKVLTEPGGTLGGLPTNLAAPLIYGQGEEYFRDWSENPEQAYGGWLGEQGIPNAAPPAAPPAEENTIAEEKLGRKKQTREHYIQIMYQRALDRLVNSLNYGGGGGEDYWTGPGGGYWGGGGGGGGYTPEESFWLNLARWNI